MKTFFTKLWRLVCFLLASPFLMLVVLLPGVTVIYPRRTKPIMKRKMRVRYVGNDPALQGTTATVCKNKPRWYIQLDQYPGGPPIAKCNPTDHPLMFGQHLFLSYDWEEI